MIHFVSPGEGADLVAKTLRSLFTAWGLEWQSFDRLSSVPRCILDALLPEPVQLILTDSDSDAISDFFFGIKDGYLPPYSEQIGEVPCHLWQIVSPVGFSAAHSLGFARSIQDKNFLADFRFTFLLPEGYDQAIIRSIDGYANQEYFAECSVILPSILLSNLCRTRLRPRTDTQALALTDENITEADMEIAPSILWPSASGSDVGRSQLLLREMCDRLISRD